MPFRATYRERHSKYVPSQGIGTLTQINNDRSRGGMFYIGPDVRAARISDVFDGTSTTLLYGEVIQSADVRDWRTLWWEDQIGRFSSEFTPNSSVPDRLLECGSGMCIDHPETNEPCNSFGLDAKDVFQLSRSRHPGGVFACLTDGSVQFFSDSIDVAIWNALGTRAGGEVVKAR